MVSLLRGGCRFPIMAAALALGIWVISASSALAHGGGGGGGGGGGHGGGGFGGGGFGGGHMGGFGGMGGYGGMGGWGGAGRMGGVGGWGGGWGGVGRVGGWGGYGGFRGYGFGGFYPGFFGLGLGYGYGYPFYGGFGYGYPYYAAYGYSDPYYGGYAYPYTNPVVMSPTVGFGYSSAYVAPGTGAVNAAVTRGRYLGIDEEPVVDAGGRKGMKVGNVYPGTPAERSGLQAGDVIHSINGYLTEQRGNLAWIIANAAPNNILKMSVRTASDGQEHTVTAQLP